MLITKTVKGTLEAGVEYINKRSLSNLVISIHPSKDSTTFILRDTNYGEACVIHHKLGMKEPTNEEWAGI